MPVANGSSERAQSPHPLQRSAASTSASSASLSHFYSPIPETLHKFVPVDTPAALPSRGSAQAPAETDSCARYSLYPIGDQWQLTPLRLKVCTNAPSFTRLDLKSLWIPTTKRLNHMAIRKTCLRHVRGEKRLSLI